MAASRVLAMRFGRRRAAALAASPPRWRLLTSVGSAAHNDVFSSSQANVIRRARSFSSLVSIHDRSAVFTARLGVDRFNPHIKHQQVRWKRKDGARFHGKQRPPTKKQRRKYNLKMKRIQDVQNKIGKPGSKAGIRREWAAREKQEILNEGKEKPEDDPLLSDEYGESDALLDDLMGNVKAATPTPEPLYLGHKHKTYYNRVADHMDDYRKYQEQLKLSQLEGTELTVPPVDLPSDYDISLSLRAFRDKKGTRQKPVGIIAALQHVLQDLQVPLAALQERSYTALLMCCRTVPEARRVLKMMREQQIPISAYSWSILCDIHAKVGDFEGCVAVQEEMLKEGGIAPTLASFTSLLAACYKVCMDGRIAHSIRTKAAEVGWEKWQEMRIVGIEADVMAYGAILRIMAARGQPEKAINLLEEMQRFGVKPTTLCFTSALRAVARSHSIAIRYERGSSRRNRRREYLTSHHGKMARSIVIMAESAGADQDDGFVAALCLCAAEAGDAATAKAIYVASQIRRLDQFRTIGPDSHLARLRGEDVPDESTIDLLPHEQQGQVESSSSIDSEGERLPSIASDDHSLVSSRRKKGNYRSFGEREYGKDNRILSAILHACAQSVDKNGIGTMWQGRENKGYLCANSLRLIATPRLPQYTDDSIPGQTITDSLTLVNEHRNEEGYREGKRKSRKFDGIEEDEEAGSTMDELDESFSREFLDKDGRRKEKYRRATPEDIWRLKYGNEDLRREQEERLALQAKSTSSRSAIASGASIDAEYRTKTDTVSSEKESETDLTSDESLDADYKSMLESFQAQGSSDTFGFEYDATSGTTRSLQSEVEYAERVQALEKSSVQSDAEVSTDDSEKEEMVFDTDTMRWKMLPKDSGSKAAKSSATMSGETENSEKSDDDDDDDDDTEMYFDSDEMRWKTRPRAESKASKLTKFEAEALTESAVVSDVKDNGNGEEEPVNADDEESFAMFLSDLRQEAMQSGEGNVSEEEAKEIYQMMKDEYNEVLRMSPEELLLADQDGAFNSEHIPNLEANTVEKDLSSDSWPKSASGTKDIDEIVDELKSEWKGQKFDSSEEDLNAAERAPEVQSTSRSDMSQRLESKAARTTEKRQAVITYDAYEEPMTIGQETENKVVQSSAKKSLSNAVFTETVEFLDGDEVEEADAQLEELREALPYFSDKRLRKIQRTFQKSLDDPHLLELIPIVRENMPDYITATWLKKSSALTAKYVLQKAEQDEVVDANLLNSVLSLEASAGSLDRALFFHQTEFKARKVKPTAYSDRLVLQMFLKNNRLSRALAFKEKLKDSGRTLDLKGYGSLIDYCSRRQQLGSAVMLLKECLSVHHAHPEEATLRELRLLCRQTGLTDAIGLTDMIGKDPLQWLRHGEANLKRDMSKRGRKNVQFAQNQVTRL